jgi:hypothetical protein
MSFLAPVHRNWDVQMRIEGKQLTCLANSMRGVEILEDKNSAVIGTMFSFQAAFRHNHLSHRALAFMVALTLLGVEGNLQAHWELRQRKISLFTSERRLQIRLVISHVQTTPRSMTIQEA